MAYKVYSRIKCFIQRPIVTPIEGFDLSILCDYSFGDQAAVLCKIPGGKMKLANLNNVEFKDVVRKISRYRNYMTVFIDNIRLYKRNIDVDVVNREWIDELMAENDLLRLCSCYREMNFVIFTNLEDTPIDIHIEGRIPSNVLAIHATNAIYNSEKIYPFPYGIQRRMWWGDIRKEILLSKMHDVSQPAKLWYVNHSVHTNVSARSGIKELFYDLPWATVIDSRINYRKFLFDIKNHKFVICPIGNAIDCHRNWEVLYMRRVPVMIKNDYLEKLFENLPVLFVDNYSDVSEELLAKNNHLFEDALTFDVRRLDLNVLFSEKVECCLKNR
jgi:hypothetical protein